MGSDQGRQTMRVVLCWHMHQPDYRRHGRLLKPWTWLHAIKDYSDMAAHLEDIPGARAVVNFSPVLIRQLQDLPDRIRALRDHDRPSGDAILDALAGRRPEGAGRARLTRDLLRVNEARMMPRLAAYADLFKVATQALASGRPLATAELDDLLVGYVLAWTGESLRDQPLPARLALQGRGYTGADRQELLDWIAKTVAGLLPRYRALAESGRVELSVTPWSHPILPLMLDMESARQAMPDAELPGTPYPGGIQRCDWQLGEARKLFEEVFGHAPAGCWPSEGGLSEQTIRLLARHDFRWTASGAQVLFNSLGNAQGQPQLDAWVLAGDGGRTDHPVVIFRDDELSDRIGFEYARWPAADAVEDLVARIERRREQWDATGRDTEPLLAIIMDGENAWEYYPENARAFLHGLYTRLAQHPGLDLVTFSEALDQIAPRTLPSLLAGSWVHGTFSTWIGDPAKNRAWELLAAAKRSVDAALDAVPGGDAGEPPPWGRRILEQLAVCEASDWFWWLGPENRLQDGPAFDRLFRQQLEALYRMLGMLPPPELARPLDPVHDIPLPAQNFSPGHAGAMRPAQEARHA